MYSQEFYLNSISVSISMTALTEIKKSLCVSPCKHLQRMRSDAILKCVLNKLKLRSQKSKAHSNDSPFSALSAEVHNV